MITFQSYRNPPLIRNQVHICLRIRRYINASLKRRLPSPRRNSLAKSATERMPHRIATEQSFGRGQQSASTSIGWCTCLRALKLKVLVGCLPMASAGAGGSANIKQHDWIKLRWDEILRGKRNINEIDNAQPEYLNESVYCLSQSLPVSLHLMQAWRGKFYSTLHIAQLRIWLSYPDW